MGEGDQRQEQVRQPPVLLEPTDAPPRRMTTTKRARDVLQTRLPAVLRRAQWIVFAVPLAQIGIILSVIWTGTPSVPYEDEWSMVALMQKAQSGSLQWLDFWAPHNEHRIVIPAAVQLVLIELTRWNRQLEMSVVLLVAIGSATLLYATLRRTAVAPATSIALVVPLSLFLFSLAQAENWLAPFQIAFVGTTFGVALCAWALARRPVRLSDFGVALIGALVASFCSLPGLLDWVAFLPAVAMSGYRQLAVWVVAALAVGVPYSVGLHSTIQGSATLSDLLGYVSAYLGAPLGYPDTGQAQAFGALGLVALPLAVGGYRLLHRDLSPITVWLSVALFALLSDVVAAKGRAMLGPGQALSGRYQVFSQLWWIALLVIGAQVVALLLRRETDQGQARRPIFFATAVLVLVAGAGLIRSNVMARQYVDAVRTVQTRDQVCVLAYSLAPDTCLQEYFSPSADFVRSAAPYLRRQHLALFDGATVSGPLQALPAPPTVRVTIDTTNGRIPARYPYPPTTLRARAPIALTGWAADTQTLSPLRDFLIDVDERTDVRVTSRVARPDVAAALGQPSYLRSGYRATIPGSLVTPGAHLIGIKVVGPGGRASFVPSATVEIVAR